MPLDTGGQLGPYRIVSLLGAGGMGEVYRARDTKLERDVALKVLGSRFAQDVDRLDRFRREARTLASLNHPHIAQIFGLEETRQGETTLQALVMELVEGEDLSQRIARGPIPPDDVLAIARQVADALEAAHEQGIVHRDLKPANIKLRPDGTVKVLDFGLAKLTEQDRSASGSSATMVTISPTVASPAMTAAGIILGTAAYMSPEQARGKPVDKRTDVWSFGCVLYEMLSGRRPFDGDDVVSTMGAVVHKEPDWSALPSSMRPALRATIERCLQKDPKQRIRDIGDARLAMEGALGAGTVVTGPVVRGGMPVRTAVMAAAVAAAAAGLAVWFTRPLPPRPAPIAFDVLPRPSMRFGNFFSLSPDGRKLAFIAADLQGRQSLWIRSLETGEAREVTRAGNLNSSVIWSPDARYLAYTSLAGFMRIDTEGGPPEQLAAVLRWAGGDWTPDGVILFGRVNGSVMQVPAKGGTPVEVTKLDDARGETGHSNPMFLPDFRHFIYLATSKVPANTGIYVGSLDAKPEEQSRERLVSTTENALYVKAPGASSTGHLLYLRDGDLMAQRFDHRSLAFTGDPARVAEEIGVGPTTYAHVSVSRTGTLAYATRQTSGGGILTWFDRTGRELGSEGAVGVERAMYPKLSPDGKRLAVVIDGDVWIYDLAGRPPTRLVQLDSPGSNYSPFWTEDGRTIVYEPAGSRELRAVPTDGSVTTPRVVSPPGHFHPHGWSADGTELIVARLTAPAVAKTRWDILRMPFERSGDLIPVVETGASEGGGGAALSPNKRFLAYTSDTTGDGEVWVRAYPGPGPAERISPNGGTEPVWSKDGRELIYVEGAGRFMSVTTSTEGQFTFSAPKLLFETEISRAVQPPTYDVAPDGRILAAKAPRQPPTPITVVVNWTETVR